MTLIQYYLFANIYILAFWVGYRIALKNLVHFKSIRIYLNTALVLSALLPFIQFSIANAMDYSSAIAIGPELPLAGIAYTYQWIETIPVATGPSYNWSYIIQAILISGSVATALFYAYIHLRIRTIIRESTHYRRLEDGLRAMMSDEVSIPFVYFKRIVIPDTIANDDISQVLAHETLHHRNTHHLDNLLFSLLHVVFWVNPFFLLLRNALKLNHEYQVDHQMLSTGMDPVSYKMSLVKYSVGSKLFALANGLSSTNTKHRLMMINHLHIKKGKWRFFLLVPVILLLLAVFTFAYIEPQALETVSTTPSESLTAPPTDALSTIPQDDTLRVEIVDPREGLEGKEVVVVQNTVIVVLLNRRSEIMIAKEVTPLNQVEQKIISEYNTRLEENKDLKADDYPKSTSFETKIYVYRDIAADNIQYQKLLDAVSTALFKLRDMHSIRLYGELYEATDESNKETIDALIPLRIYGSLPKHSTLFDTPPLFKGKEKDEFMLFIAHNLEYPESAGIKDITGRVVVQVVINADGSIGDVTIKESAHPDLDQEAIRVVKSSPKWTPATKNGHKVASTLEFPMNFVLN